MQTDDVSVFDTSVSAGRTRRLLRLESVSMLHGCNIFHSRSIACARITGLDGRFANELMFDGEQAERFRQLFLTLPWIMQKPERTNAFFERAKGKQVKLVDLLLEAIVAVENSAAAMMYRLDEIAYAEVLLSPTLTTTFIGWESNSRKLAQLCAELALAGLNVIMAPAGSRTARRRAQIFDAWFEQLKSLTISRRLTTTVSIIREAAKARDIPCAYLGESYLRLGEGRFQRLFMSSSTNITSHTASKLSLSKRLTNRRLQAQRLPVPKQIHCSSPDDARKAAAKLSFPIVVKPLKGHGGEGVSVVKNARELAAAVKRASPAGGGMLVEQFLPGDYYRLLVIGGRFIAASRVDPPRVTGNGVCSVKELVEALNQDPLRDGYRMVQIALDDRLDRHLSCQGLTLADIPHEGNVVSLHSIANTSQGGAAIDVTDQVHQDNIDLAVRAVEAIGLDVAGVDLMTADIAQSYRRVGGAIVEVNARPDLSMHVWPWKGQSRDVAGALLDQVLLTADQPARIASVVIVGDHRTAVIARDLDTILRDSGRSSALAIRGRIFDNGASTEPTVGRSSSTLRALFRDPHFDSVVATLPSEAVIRRGLQVERVAACAVSAPAPNTDLNEYCAAIEVLLKAEPKQIVIAADNEPALNAVQSFPVDRIILVSRRGMDKRILQHLRSGGRAVISTWIGGHRIIEFHDSNRPTLAFSAAFGISERHSDAAAAVGSAATGRRSRRLEIRLFALALAWALGFSGKQLSEAIAGLPSVKA